MKGKDLMINTIGSLGKKASIALLLVLGNNIYASEEIWAVVKVPVTDLSVEKLTHFKDSSSTYYNKFPYSPEIGRLSCARSHQLKCNELVKVHTCLENEIECEVQHFFGLDRTQQRCKKFWGLKKDFVFLQDLPCQLVLTSIPPSYTIDESPSLSNKNILTLTHPWFNQTTEETYSVGTRFVRSSSNDTKEQYAIVTLAASAETFILCYVPLSSALVEYPQDPSQAADLFVKLLQEWVHTQDGIIPYVWGGCSHTGKKVAPSFALTSERRKEESISFWTRESHEPGPLSGFDCSGLVLCAAQICGIPYFYKNTTTASQCMKALEPEELLNKGDILWCPGHLMVITDVENNLLIEAIGYGIGYGKLHEISVEKAFKEVKNFSELVATYRKGLPLERLNNKGCPTNKPTPFKILTMKSVWKNL